MEKLILIILSFLFIISCSMGSKKEDEPTSVSKNLPVVNKPKDSVRFSDNPNVGAFSDKKYKRSTRKTLEDESEVHSRAGSLWNNEGQSAYLFTQNKSRREGDLLNVKLEGSGKSQVETKVGVIKKLLARIEMIQPVANPNAAPGMDQASPMAGGPGVTNDSRNPASAKDASKKDGASKDLTAVNGATKNATSGSGGDGIEDTPFNVDTVSTRVVERLVDGNYRVKGTQPFMIGKREYKVIVTGLVRPEDFSDEGVSSNKLIDPQWDVVSLRRVMQ